MKDFIPHKEALELKELGFDEPCFGKYLSSLQSDWKEFELILEMGMNEEFEDNRNIYLLEEACSGPTFSQAFRFFREKHGLFVAPCAISYDSGPYLWYFEINSTVLPFGTDLGETDDFKTYEEAELACLIKLIEIVKTK